jgi:hypothetical protein
MLSVLADVRKLTPFVILRRKNLPKEKLPTRIIFKCNEKGWVTEELMVEWLKEVWHRRSEEKRKIMKKILFLVMKVLTVIR